jgi:hypothetical protein
MVRHQIRHRRIAQCVFCPSRATTREHAWEDWAVQLIQTFPSVITGHFEGEELLVRYQKAIRIKCLCDYCNTRWMKRLGDDAMPFIRAMSQDVGLPLNIPEQHVVAIWATSRAMVWEFMKDASRPRPNFYTDAHRRSFRQHLTIPANTFIWLARYSGEENVGAWVSDYTKPVRCHLTTLLYARLLVQILSVRANNSDPPPSTVQPNRTIVRWPQAHSMIHPATRTAEWPPTFSIGNHVPLSDFLERWNKHPPGELVQL